MKKFALLFVVALMALANGHAFADVEWADPSLCVAGNWLMVNAANNDAIQVALPRGTAYGDQAAGGCTTPAPAPLLPLSSVTVRGEGGMHIMIDGQQASPVVVVTYGLGAQTHVNDGGRMQFRFSVDGGD